MVLEDGPLRRLRALLIKHEGLRLKPYRDSVGKLTIGVGRNIEDVGVSQIEALIMLNNDIHRIQREAVDKFAWFQSIGSVRQDVILSMVFNMGMGRLLGFSRMLRYVAAQDYLRAADEMLASEWATQVGLRAQELAQMMRSGVYPLDPT